MAALKLYFFFSYFEVTHYPETMQQRADGGGGEGGYNVYSF